MPAKLPRKRFNLIIAAIVIAVIYFVKAGQGFYQQHTEAPPTAAQGSAQTQSLAAANAPLLTAHQHHARDIFVEGRGVVEKVLRDDNEGDRHQRFILNVGDGVTVLVAHNIDVAPRIANLQAGDSVGYAGEYIYSDKGGILHWTHRDLRGNHRAGWLEVNGKRYQ